jgi:hypothetical protein
MRRSCYRVPFSPNANSQGRLWYPSVGLGSPTTNTSRHRGVGGSSHHNSAVAAAQVISSVALEMALELHKCEALAPGLESGAYRSALGGFAAGRAAAQHSRERRVMAETLKFASANSLSECAPVTWA